MPFSSCNPVWAVQQLAQAHQYRGAFPSDGALIKLLYLALRNIGKKWTMPIRQWEVALNQFAIQYEEMLLNSESNSRLYKDMHTLLAGSNPGR